VNDDGMHKRLMELSRFVVIGGGCFLLGLLLVYVFTDKCGLHYLAALSISLVIVNIVGWLLNRGWTFKMDSPRSGAEFGRYLAVNAAGFFITLISVHVLVSWVGMHYLWASAWVAAGMIFVNFLVHRRISFRLR
jgi:putative flippase GtrA